jgi:hypothetical protein
MTWWRKDPGDCPVCGAPHSACTAVPGAPIIVEQLPATARALARAQAAITDPAPVTRRTFTTSSFRRGRGVTIPTPAPAPNDGEESRGGHAQDRETEEPQFAVNVTRHSQELPRASSDRSATPKRTKVRT